MVGRKGRNGPPTLWQKRNVAGPQRPHLGETAIHLDQIDDENQVVEVTDSVEEAIAGEVIFAGQSLPAAILMRAESGAGRGQAHWGLTQRNPT